MLHIANTAGIKNLRLSFNLLSLGTNSPRTTTWSVQYGTQNSGIYTFSAIEGTYTTGANIWNSQEINIDLPVELNDRNAPVWIRILASGASTGSGNRASTAIDDFALTYETVDANAPVLTASPASLTGFSYNVGEGPSTAQSYLLNAANLADEEGTIYVQAPAGYEISLEETTGFSSELQVAYFDNGISSKRVYVRLKTGLPAGNYNNQTLLNSTGELSAQVSLSGSVLDPTSPCNAVSIPIADARAASAGTVVTITGRVTALTLANHNVYLKDGDGPSDGILLFDNGVLRPEDLAVGDEIQVTGTRAIYSGMIQLSGLTCLERTEAAPVAPQPVTITGDDLCNYEGQLVSIAGVTIQSDPEKLAGNTTYTLSDGTTLYIHNNSGIGGSSAPEGAATFTGIVTLYQNVCQLSPRFIEDIPGATPPAQCGLPMSNITNDEAQLEVVNWNVEWLGHSGNGTGSGQLANVLNGILAMQADVFLLQEVCSYNASNPADPATAFGSILQELNTQYPARNYTGECSSAYSYSYEASPDPQGQRVCIVYRSDQVTKISSKPLMQEIYPSGITNYPTGTNTQFWSSGRLPFLLEADVTIGGKTARMHFISIHSKANTNPQDMSYERRKYDHRVFHNYLEAEYPDASIIIAGDFNDDFDQSIYQYGSNNISSWSPFLYTDPAETDINGARPNSNWTPLTYKFSGTGCSSSQGFSTFIDHVIVSNEISYAAPESRTAADNGFVASTVETVRGTVSAGAGRASDHFPTFVRYQLLSTLPVTLSEFHVSPGEQHDMVNVRWTTTTERNSSHFEVERSGDARSFETIGTVSGTLNSEKPVSYTFTDAGPSDGINYYRLKMVDLDGSFEYSEILSADLPARIQVSPNPVITTTRITGVQSFSSWTLYSPGGLPLKNGNSASVDLTGLGSGLYLLKIERKSGEPVIRKILKQ